MQLRHSVDTDLMYSNYWYRSGTNQTMRDHLSGITNEVEERLSLKEDDIVIDTGCNDGTLLKSYNQTGLVKVGVDPSNAILAIGDEHQIVKINDYFTYNTVKEYAKDGCVKAITSISMFYDLDQPSLFVQDVKRLLHDDGIWIVEMNYTGDMIDNLGYDMISHEHVAYYTFLTFEYLITSNGMFVKDVSSNSINGGSLRFVVGKQPGETRAVGDLRKNEIMRGLDSMVAYRDFARRVEEFKQSLIGLVSKISNGGQIIMAYGASTRGNTVMQHCGFTREQIPFALDRNPLKYGMEMSGTRIPIISEKSGREFKPDYLMVLPYYFLEEFINREMQYLMDGGKLIVYLPELRIISFTDGKIIEEAVNFSDT
jgi:SAM-dependent methyltransferase